MTSKIKIQNSGGRFRLFNERNMNFGEWTDYRSIATMTDVSGNYFAVTDYFTGTEGIKAETVYTFEEYEDD